MTSLVKRRAVAAAVLIALSVVAWFFAQPRVPDGQAPLVTLDAASISSLRGAFNRDVDHVRIIVLPSPT